MKEVYSIDDDNIICPDCGCPISEINIQSLELRLVPNTNRLFPIEPSKRSKILIYKCPCCEKIITIDISDKILELDVGENKITINEFGEIQ